MAKKAARGRAGRDGGTPPEDRKRKKVRRSLSLRTRSAKDKPPRGPEEDPPRPARRKKR